MKYKIEELTLPHPERGTTTLYEVVEIIGDKPHRNAEGGQTFSTREEAQNWIDLKNS